VLPDVPAIDRAFDYLVPAELRADVHVGTIVRVPLHGRRVRGWVLELDVEPATARERTLPLHAVVSAGPPSDIVDLAVWAAWRWAGPRTAFLRAASPPNIVSTTGAPERHVAVFPPRDSPMAVPDGRRRIVRWPPARDRWEVVRALAAPEGSTIILAAGASEANALVGALAAEGRHVVELRGDQPAAERAVAWGEARRGACVVVGGRVAVFAPVPDLQAIVVLDDLDEALEEERAPSWHALDLAVERAERAGARLDVVSPAPGAGAMAIADAIAAPARGIELGGWARLETVDLRAEPPGAGLLSTGLADALRRALTDGGRALCVLNRRGRARLLVCKRCGELARCERCDAAVREVAGGHECPRCGDPAPGVCTQCGAAALQPRKLGVVGVREHLAALVPRARVVAVEAGSAPLPAFDVAIGTEAVLHRAAEDPRRPVRLVAFLDLDQELLAPRYRAEEQALWLLVRASRCVGRRGPSGGVVLVQTRLPDHPVVRAARDGDPAPLLEADLARRRALGFPPFGGLAELSGDAPAVDAASSTLQRHSKSLTILGPSGARALLRSPSTKDLCDTLAAVDLAPARALGRLRVDVDPRRV
jgi:primosomal protein N' (replication factor Y)